jgi:GNAT acetyltransferase-like protein
VQATQRERYRRFSEQSDSLTLFLRSWWLDATCGPEAWDVALAEHAGEIVGALPYLRRTRFGMVMLTQPQLTQHLGPWIGAAFSSSVNPARAKDIMEELIAGLPPFTRYSQNWSPAITNWLPFHWAGFKQTTRYTMRLPELSDLDAVWRGFQANARTDIRKATGRFQLRLRPDPTLSDFLDVNRLTFARQHMKVPYSREYVARLNAACVARNCSKIFVAEDANGRAHAAAYLVWDANAAYYLMGGGDPALRNSGATSFCIWEAIRFAATVSKAFDFEGSMIESVERFFRSFGALHVPYYHVTQNRSFLLRLRAALLQGAGS